MRLLTTTTLFAAATAASSAFAVVHDKISGHHHLWHESSDEPQELQLRFAVPQRNLDRLEALVKEVSEPSSPKYGKYFSNAQVGELVANPAATQAVLTWLTQAEAVQSVKPSVHGEYVSAVAHPSVWGKLLGTTFKSYTSDNAESPIARAASCSVPSELAAHVESIFNCAHFPRPDLERVPSRRLTKHDDVTLGPYCTPEVLNTAYNFTTNSCGGHGSICLFETNGQNFDPTDLATFQKNYSIPPHGVDDVIGGCNQTNYCKWFDYDCGEASLDVQYALAQAQDLSTTVWGTGKITFDAWLQMVSETNKPPLVLSMSYGEAESLSGDSERSAFNKEAMKLALQGVTVVVSSGDDGVAGTGARTSVGLCGYNPQWPATSPYTTTVGATQGPENYTQPEVVCSSHNWNTYITSGGGFSETIPAPDYQKEAVKAYLATPSNALGGGYHKAGRAYPDVALIGHMYPVEVGGQKEVKDGTSASTPVFAAIVALVNGKRIAAGKPPVGFANPALYGALSKVPGVFNDITEGVNNCAAGGWDGPAVCCPQNGFKAVKGWDPASGLGSVNVGKLIDAWVAL